MKELFSSILAALKANEPVELCTVIESEGSAPRGKGAKMAVFSNGTVLGTVGGGKVELMAIERAKELLQQRQSLVRDYELEISGDTGMACGGAVRIAFCCLTESSLDAVAAIVRAYGERENAWLRILLPSLTLCFEANADTVTPVLEENAYTEPLVRKETVFVFGCGHVALEVVPLLAHVGFRVIAIDPRPYLATKERFPSAFDVRCGSFSEINKLADIGAEDYILIMTPGHQADFEVLCQALKTPAQYIGCIGSRKKIARTKQMLAQNGFTQEEIDRMTAPIGIPIGSETPEEIAVSVAGQLILHRAESRKASK